MSLQPLHMKFLADGTSISPLLLGNFWRVSLFLVLLTNASQHFHHPRQLTGKTISAEARKCEHSKRELCDLDVLHPLDQQLLARKPTYDSLDPLSRATVTVVTTLKWKFENYHNWKTEILSTFNDILRKFGSPCSPFELHRLRNSTSATLGWSICEILVTTVNKQLDPSYEVSASRLTSIRRLGAWPNKSMKDSRGPIIIIIFSF